MMKINPDPGARPPEQAHVERRQAGQAVELEPRQAARAEDTAKFTRTTDRVSEWRAELDRAPEARQDRMAEVRAARSEGRLEASDQQIADAILRELSGDTGIR